MNNQRDIDRIVQAAGTHVPRIEVGAEQYDFVRQAPAGNLRHNVRSLERRSDLIGHFQTDLDTLALLKEANEAQAIFTSDQGRRDRIQLR